MGPVILRLVADLLEQLTPEQQRGLVGGQGVLVYAPVPSSVGRTGQAPDPRALGPLAERLLGFTSRAEAAAWLKTEPGTATKAQLVGLARYLGVHTAKSDTKEKLVERLVEFAVGSRLRSEAIREVRLR